MQDSQLATISNFIWNIADTVLRDLYVRGKYRDVILPMTVIRRLDAVLEPTKQQVIDEKKWLDEAGISDQTGPLQLAAGTAVLQRLSVHPERPQEFPPLSSNSETTSTPTWTGSLPTSRTSWRSSSSETR